MQPVWDPTVTLVPFITLLLPAWRGVAGRVLCYVQLGYFVPVPGFLQITVLAWNGCTPACLPAFVIPLGSRILDSPGGSSGMSEFLKHLGSPGLWLEWMWL